MPVYFALDIQHVNGGETLRNMFDGCIESGLNVLLSEKYLN